MSSKTAIETKYAAYGNEAAVGHAYGRVNLILKVTRRTGTRMDVIMKECSEGNDGALNSY